MPSRSACEAELERLHDCFVEWFTAGADEEEFDRIADALAPGFEMVTPAGERVGRAAVLDSIRESYGRDGPGTFDIDIRKVELRQEGDSYATVRYEEWQETSEGTTGRVSTALLREDSEAPGGLVWVDLHETWLA